MWLVLFGGILIPQAIDIIKRMTKKPSPRIVYIPSDSTYHKAGVYFDGFKKTMQEHGIQDIIYYPLEQITPQTYDASIFASADIVYLSWGNTGHFLHLLKTSWVYQHLLGYAKNGIIAWCSAGALILTPDILSHHESETPVTWSQWLGLVPFQVSPHYEHNTDHDYLCKYSATTDRLIRWLSDNDVIITHDDQTTILGHPTLYVRWSDYPFLSQI